MYPDMECLILDTKPHFKASHMLNGLRADILYRNWTKGDYFPKSLILSARDMSVSLDYAFEIAHGISGRMRGATVIVQTDTRNDYNYIARRVFEQYKRANKRRKVYEYFDETYSLLKYNRYTAEAVTISVTAGGERGVGVMAASQRPRWITVEMLSEMTRFYCFRLDNSQDKSNLRNNGLPPGFIFPINRYEFHYYNALTDEQRMLKLRLAA